MCVSIIRSHLLGICSTFTHTITHTYVYAHLYVSIHICAFQFEYMRGMFGSNFSHKTGRNVDNYFHFRRGGYFYLQRNQILVLVLYLKVHELKS